MSQEKCSLHFTHIYSLVLRQMIRITIIIIILIINSLIIINLYHCHCYLLLLLLELSIELGNEVKGRSWRRMEPQLCYWFPAGSRWVVPKYSPGSSEMRSPEPLISTRSFSTIGAYWTISLSFKAWKLQRDTGLTIIYYCILSLVICICIY